MMKCSICGRVMSDINSNNAWPVRKSVDDRCCNLCNQKYVIPFRIMNMRSSEEDTKQIVELLDNCTADMLDRLLNY